jgi:chromosome segregation ATPase
LDPLKADIKSNTSQLATANQTIADNKKSSDAAFLVVNQSITSLDTKVADNTTAIKANTSSITTINTKLTDQQNQIVDNRNQISTTNNNLNTQIGGLQGQLNTTNSTVSNLTGTAEVISNKSTAVDLGGTNPSDQLYPSQKAAKAYVDQVVSQIATSGVPDATTLAAGKLQLAGDLGGTATSPTVPALSGKENSSNKCGSSYHGNCFASHCGWEGR